MDNIKFTKIDFEVYNLIKNKKKISFLDIGLILKIDIDAIRRSLELLKPLNIISEEIENIDSFEITDIGKDSIENGLIEKIFCDFVKDKNIKITDLKNIDIKNLTKEEISLAFGLAKKSNLITLESGIISVNPNYLEITNSILNKLKNISLVTDKQTIDTFLKRKLILKKQKTYKKYTFLKEVDFKIIENNFLFLTPELLKSGEYKNIKFKEFEVNKIPKPLAIGRTHPLRKIIMYMREIYLEMGFKEMSSPYVDVSFWPMDSMFISQDHPMRDIQDTFYLPIKGDLPDDKLLEKISKTHEDGGDTTSIGHQYKWDKELAKQLVLRTHTTAATFRKFYSLSESERKESKYFSIGKVFRNETIDSTHLPEFHQAEGFVIGKDLSLADLIGFIKVFLKKLGIEEIKIKPTYNPYTEPSIEVFAYFTKSNKWVEVMNSGLFRKETLAPYDIKGNVIAWGIGIERIAMLMYDKKNIKDIFGDECDIDWLRSYVLPQRKLE